MEVTAAEVRKLVARSEDDGPVTSVYLNTDGARYPTPSDYLARLDGLLRDVRRSAEQRPADDRDKVLADADTIKRRVRDEFERGDVRGLGLFATEGRIFEEVHSAIGVRNVARVNSAAYVVPLQVLLGRRHLIGLIIVQRDEARIFRYSMGRLEEYGDLSSDVHGQHAQGGWSQTRFERTIEHEVLHHMKEASEVLLRAHEDEPFDAVVAAGPRIEALEFTKQLHPYVKERLHGDPVSLQLSAGPDEIRERLQEVEQELVSGRRSELLQRLMASRGVAESGAFGPAEVIDAANRRAIDTLFVVEGSGVPGFRSETGALALREEEAAAFGGGVVPVEDIVDELIEVAVLGGSRIELFRDGSRLDGNDMAALLRY